MTTTTMTTPELPSNIESRGTGGHRAVAARRGSAHPAERSLIQRCWYRFMRFIMQLAFVTIYQLRVRGRQYEPATGGMLVVSNHQSHFDPMLVGISCQRDLHYLARETLFAFAPFRWLIRSLNAIPIDREGMGLSGIRETLRRLKHHEAVLIFPEGTRSRDGEVAPLKPGFCAIARRGKVLLLPVGIDGAFDALPRNRWLPRRSAINVQFGPPLAPDEVASLSDDELVAEIHRRIASCHAAARAARQLAGGSVSAAAQES